ncbi:hypothetical protein [Pseudohongiella spirulinae]|uniref:Uncharacterized protein n=1 Tax=Pseudohongiella spirulinae TaxID=1249552 RepID=A0A0S2KEZ0_9GAMM|nr:hypothetical protein [Pseudohongiella spirulinae]ALO46612.1 hypothetical protein PS2015_1970 [Pseudohongiella spirulinae]
MSRTRLQRQIAKKMMRQGAWKETRAVLRLALKLRLKFGRWMSIEQASRAIK